jgi:hypothetical protein
MKVTIFTTSLIAASLFLSQASAAARTNYRSLRTTTFTYRHHAVDPLRIYFWLPQGNSADVKVGQSINVVFPMAVNKTMQAKLATTSNAIAPNSRTLLVELHMTDPHNEIQADSYAEVRLPPSILGKILTVPDTALVFRAQGLQVGVLKPDNTVELRDIKVGRDFAKTVKQHGLTNFLLTVVGSQKRSDYIYES